jgi:hypothetical protein
VAVRPEPRIVIAGIVAELPPLAVRDLVFADIERIELDGMDRPFARLAVAEVVAILNGPAGTYM